MEAPSQVIIEAQNLVRSYQVGKEPYPALSDPREVLDVTEKGESIVLLGAGGNALGGIFVGATFVIIGIITMIVVGIVYEPYMIIWMACIILIPGLIILLIAILFSQRNKKRFLVLHPSALVYKIRGGPIRAFAWKELELDIKWKKSEVRSYGVLISSITSPMILLKLPTGSTLVIEPHMFKLVSFRSWKVIGEENLYKLLTLAFEMYFKRGQRS
jgi:hypothetical protein